MSKASSSAHVSSKRLVENIELAPPAKRQALETSLGSPKSSSPNRVAALSRDSSFKNLDRERLRPVQQTSSGKQSTNDMLESARSPVGGPRLKMHKGKQIAFAACTCFYICSYICCFFFQPPIYFMRWGKVYLLICSSAYVCYCCCLSLSLSLSL